MKEKKQKVKSYRENGQGSRTESLLDDFHALEAGSTKLSIVFILLVLHPKRLFCVLWATSVSSWALEKTLAIL